MSFMFSLMQMIRGWLPEDPKMPKTVFQNLRRPIALFCASTVIVSLFSSCLLFFQPISALPVPQILSAAPNSSLVVFNGQTDEHNSFAMVMSDGSYLHSENVSLKFSITKLDGDACKANIALESDSYSNEATVDGKIVNGSLVVDSRRSLFLINPNHSKSESFVLTENGDWSLLGYVSGTSRRFSTADESCGVTALVVHVVTRQTDHGWPFSGSLGYEKETGMLIYAGYSLCDVLLEKIGINHILGDTLGLSAYSDNLDLEFSDASIMWERMYVSMFWFYFELGSLVVFSITVVVLVIVHKVRKRRMNLQVSMLTGKT